MQRHRKVYKTSGAITQDGIFGEAVFCKLYGKVTKKWWFHDTIGTTSYDGAVMHHMICSDLMISKKFLVLSLKCLKKGAFRKKFPPVYEYSKVPNKRTPYVYQFQGFFPPVLPY